MGLVTIAAELRVNMSVMKLTVTKLASELGRRELRLRFMSLDRRKSSREMSIAATDLLGLNEEQVRKLLAQAIR